MKEFDPLSVLRPKRTTSVN